MEENKLQDAIRILSIPSVKRSNVEIRILADTLSQFKYFRNLREENGKEALHSCCRFLQMTRFNQNETVISFGDVGKYFYVLLTGRVSVMIHMEEEGFQEATKLFPGDEFGHLSLLSGKPISATIKCLEASIVLHLNKKNYNFLLKTYHVDKQNEKLEFLVELDPFKNWSRRQMAALALLFKIQKFKRGQTVYREGDESNNVFVIKKGEFKFYKEHTLRMNFLKLSQSKRSLQLCIKQEKEIFGFEDILNGTRFRQATCECSSTEGELYIITAKEFKKRISHSDSFTFFSSRNQVMKQWTQNRLENLQKVELFKAKQQFSSYTPSTRPNTGVRIVKEYISIPITPSVTYKHKNDTPSAKTDRKKKNKSCKFFSTEIHEDKKPNYKTPDIGQIRNILIDFRPQKLNALRRTQSRYIKRSNKAM